RTRIDRGYLVQAAQDRDGEVLDRRQRSGGQREEQEGAPQRRVDQQRAQGGEHALLPRPRARSVRGLAAVLAFVALAQQTTPDDGRGQHQPEQRRHAQGGGTPAPRQGEPGDEQRR